MKRMHENDYRLNEQGQPLPTFERKHDRPPAAVCPASSTQPDTTAPKWYSRGKHPNTQKNLALGRGKYWPRRSPSPPSPPATQTTIVPEPSRTDVATSQRAESARAPLADATQKPSAASAPTPSPASHAPAPRQRTISYLNRFVAPDPLVERLWHITTPPEKYDLNFAFDLPPPILATDGVALFPLIPSIHARRLFALYTTHAAGFAYLPYGPFETFAAFLTWIETRRRQTGSFLFVVYDLTLEFDDGKSETDGLREERIAGIVGIKSSEPERMAELGHLHIPAPFQRSHVFTHAAYLLLVWLFNNPLPSAPPGQVVLRGLGLRRVQWAAGSHNTASINAALRLGFVMEASDQQWERPLAKDRGKVEGVELPAFVHGAWREREEEIGLGRHSALLSMGWDRWRSEAKAKVERMILERPVVRRKAEDVLGSLAYTS